MALPKINDWSAFRRHLKLLSEVFPGQFTEWVLIGGGACWFYRTVLERWADADFPAPGFSEADEKIWLSKDIDFMGATVAQAEVLLGAAFKVETHTISFRGIEVDFLEEGVKLTRDVASRNARQARTPDFAFRVLDAGWLYAEKLAVTKSKPREQDGLHLRLLETFLKCEFCRDSENPTALDAQEWVERAKVVKTADHDFFERDARLVTRLQTSVRALTQHEHRALKHWAKHHLPGYTE